MSTFRAPRKSRRDAETAEARQRRQVRTGVFIQQRRARLRGVPFDTRGHPSFRDQRTLEKRRELARRNAER